MERRAADDPAALRTMPFLPHFLLRDLFAWTAVLALMAAWRPSTHGSWARKRMPSHRHRPGSVLSGIFSGRRDAEVCAPTLGGIDGESLAVLVMGAGAVGVLLLPFLAGCSPRAQRLVLWIGAGVLGFMTFMTGLSLAGAAP